MTTTGSFFHLASIGSCRAGGEAGLGSAGVLVLCEGEVGDDPDDDEEELGDEDEKLDEAVCWVLS